MTEREELVINTLDLWPRKAFSTLNKKNIDPNKLKKLFGSKVIFPWDDKYDKHRMLFSTQIQERPLFIVIPKSEDDILSVLDLLDRRKLSIRIVGGRHSTALQNPDVFLDMSYFNKISSGKYITVQAGATQGQVNSYLFDKHPELHFPGAKPNHPNSLTFPGGSAATVGVAGISTVGGIGTLRRTFGLTIDSIKEFKIALPPKQPGTSSYILTASKYQNSDLFFALRGGGAANFGVVIEIAYYKQKVGNVVLYDVKWPFERAEDVLTKWQKTAPNRSNKYNEDLSISNDDKGELQISLTGLYVLESEETKNQAVDNIVRELKYLGGSLSIYPSEKYSDIYDKFIQDRVYHNFSVAKTFLTEKCIPASVLINQAKSLYHFPGRLYIGLQLMGGAISDIGKYDTAFWLRDAKFFVDIFNFWDSPVDQEDNIKWNNNTYWNLYPIAGPHSYLGFPVPNLPKHLESYYGDNKNKLLRIKNKYDPQGLLKFPGSL